VTATGSWRNDADSLPVHCRRETVNTNAGPHLKCRRADLGWCSCLTASTSCIDSLSGPIGKSPQIAAGVYAIWRDTGQLIYVGMSGKGIESVTAAPTRFGLYTRLNSHANGRLSGDQFCVYVANRLVVPDLTPDQLSQFANGELNLDTLVKAYVRQHFSYSYVLVNTTAEAFALERDAQRGITFGDRPLLNPL